MKFSIKDFLSKCVQIRGELLIWSRLQKKSLMENFIFAQWTLHTTYNVVSSEMSNIVSAFRAFMCQMRAG